MERIKQWLRAFLGINDERNGQRFEEIMLGIGATNEKLARIEAMLEYRAQAQPRFTAAIYPSSWEEVQAVALAQFDDPKKGN